MAHAREVMNVFDLPQLLVGKKIVQRAKQFIDQDAPVLRVILELDDVVVAVVAAHQVGLRAATHPAYLL
jgi:hypothetical protein